jgi:hypothetical protein
MYPITQYQRELTQAHFDDLLRDARAARPVAHSQRRHAFPHLVALVRRRRLAARAALRPSF